MSGKGTSAQLENLKKGLAPGRGGLLQEITCGTGFLTDFFTRHYLESYIPEGGSKIKFVTGHKGAGKTHLLQLLETAAEEKGFLTVSLTANEVWLHDFREIYLAVLKRCNLTAILRGCADAIIREMGYDPKAIPVKETLIDYLAGRNEADPLSKSTIRTALRQRFTQNPLMDNCFAACCALLVGDILGHPVLEASERDMILAFLYGDKTVKPSQMRAVGITPSKVTKYNARYLLRSLAELVHMSGYAGMLITVDDMERLMNRSTEELIRYTKTKREDAYESIRQLIDDIDSMHYLLFLLSFDRELIDNESYGLKSYQALWMRIQNEIVSKRLNRFADILDLDRLADQVYTPELLCEMSEKLADALTANGIPAVAISKTEAEELEEAAMYGSLGLPYLVNRKVLTGGADHV